MGHSFRLAVWIALTGAGLMPFIFPMQARGEPGSEKEGAAGVEHYRLMESARAELGQPILLELFSASVSGQSLDLRLGFRNIGDVAISTSGLLTPEDYQLTEEATTRKIETTLVDPALSVVCPLDGLGPNLTNAGMVSFAKPAGRGPFKLRVPGFEPIGFSLDPTRSIRPPRRTERFEISPDAVLKSSAGTVAPLALHVSRIEIGEQEIRFHLSFENTSNNRFQLPPGAPAGSDANLLDGHLVRCLPKGVSPEFERSIGPPEHSWAPAEQIAGTLTFSRPPATALVTLTLSMPGFDSLFLNFDEATGAYQTKVVEPETGDRAAEGSVVPSGGLPEELSACLQAQSDALNRGDEAGYLARFTGSSAAKPEQQAFLASMAKVPVASFRFKLAPGQELTASRDGKRIDKVLAFMDYSIDGAAAAERFRSFLRCGFVRESASSPWLIDAWEFTLNPPFWLLGLTERHATDHFLVFYRIGPTSERILSISCRQLEQAYTELQQYTELELGERYLVFLVDEGEHFDSIIGMAGDHIQGAASASYDVQGSDFTVLNRAMFINDESLSKQTWWGAARQKTITHELVHLVLSGDTRPFTPRWLVEGAAVHLTNQIDTRTRWALLRSGSLESISLAGLSQGEFPGHGRGGTELSLEYHYSGEAVRHLVKRVGLGEFLDYYRAFAKVSPADIEALWRKHSATGAQGKNPMGSVTRELTDQLSKKHLKADLEELDQQVKAAILKKK